MSRLLQGRTFFAGKEKCNLLIAEEYITRLRKALNDKFFIANFRIKEVRWKKDFAITGLAILKEAAREGKMWYFSNSKNDYFPVREVVSLTDVEPYGRGIIGYIRQDGLQSEGEIGDICNSSRIGLGIEGSSAKCWQAYELAGWKPYIIDKKVAISLGEESGVAVVKVDKTNEDIVDMLISGSNATVTFIRDNVFHFLYRYNGKKASKVYRNADGGMAEFFPKTHTQLFITLPCEARDFFFGDLNDVTSLALTEIPAEFDEMFGLQ